MGLLVAHVSFAQLFAPEILTKTSILLSGLGAGLGADSQHVVLAAFRAARSALYAQRTNFCYRDGLQFLTAYAAFNLMMERSLHTINPRVSLPFWNYMIDATTLGTE